MPYGMSDVDYAREVDRKKASGLTQPLDKVAYERGKAQLTGGSGSKVSTPTPSGGGSSGDFWSQYTGGKEGYTGSQIQRYVNAINTGNTDLARRLEADAQRIGYSLPKVNQNTDLEQRLAVLEAAASKANEPIDYEKLLSQYPVPEAPEVLSWEEAQNRAEASLNPLYEQESAARLKALEQDLIRRGFFGQMPSVPVIREEAASIENARNAAIANLAQQMVGQSEQNVQNAQQLAQQAWATKLGAVMNAAEAQRQQRQDYFTNLLSLLTTQASIESQKSRDQLAWEQFRRPYSELTAAEKAQVDLATSEQKTAKSQWEAEWPYKRRIYEYELNKPYYNPNQGSSGGSSDSAINQVLEILLGSKK